MCLKCIGLLEPLVKRTERRKIVSINYKKAILASNSQTSSFRSKHCRLKRFQFLYQNGAAAAGWGNSKHHCARKVGHVRRNQCRRAQACSCEESNPEVAK